MNARQSELVGFYEQFRVRDQLAYYRTSQGDFEAAQSQWNLVAGVALILGSAAAFLGGAGTWPAAALWGILAAAFPAIAAALTACARLQGYERLSKLYGDAAGALGSIDRCREGASEAATEEAIQDYVARVEAVFRREQDQWGQLTADLSPQFGVAREPNR